MPMRYIRHSHNEVSRQFAHGEHKRMAVQDLIEDLKDGKTYPEDQGKKKLDVNYSEIIV